MNEVQLNRDDLQRTINLLVGYKTYLLKDSKSSTLYTVDAINDILQRLANAVTR